jgi:OFA family oxalate/formate antiporter-like MFS transporter
MGSIWLLYLGFGLIAGLGNGFGYVTPIATLIRWFPDKRGLVTGLAVMGFGLGRLFWAWTSDAIGRKNVFLTMFITQAILYILLPQIGDKIIFTVIACYLLACYGGGSATMPAFVADSFGPAYIGKVYGMMLTAWGIAGVVGPLVFAQMKGIALYVAAGLLIIGSILAFAYKQPALKSAR